MNTAPYLEISDLSIALKQDRDTRLLRSVSLSVEPGVNESYQEAIQRILSESRQRISVWGPYEASAELYERFLAQKSFCVFRQVPDQPANRRLGRCCLMHFALHSNQSFSARVRVSPTSWAPITSTLVRGR